MSTKYGGRWLSPNAHRTLLQARLYIRLAWVCLRAAIRWQWRGL